MAAQFVTPAAINFMAKHGRGDLVPTTSERLQQLGIERMVEAESRGVPHGFQGERGCGARHRQRHQRGGSRQTIAVMASPAVRMIWYSRACFRYALPGGVLQTRRAHGSGS